MRRLALVLASIAIHLGACGTPDGRLIVLVESDLPDLVHVEVSTARLAGGGLDTRGFAIGSPPVATTFPFSFAVEPNGHPDDGVEIIVAGYDRDPSGATPVVSRTVRTGFVPGSTRLVRVSLTRSCRNVLCDSGTTTCELGTCQPIPLVPANGLPVVAHPGAEFEDAGIDAAIRDGGLDAPGLDAPGTDAPGTDAPGTDAPGTDAPGTDAPGTDGGFDAATGIDAGMDVDAGPRPMPVFRHTIDPLLGSDRLGAALALDYDGTHALLSAFLNGEVRLYARSGAAFGLALRYSLPPGAAVGDVALAHGAGAPCTVRIGTPGAAAGSFANEASCTAVTLTPVASLLGTADATHFGWAIAVDGTGHTVVGAPSGSPDAGDAFVYTPAPYTTVRSATSTGAGSHFGASVAISDDGHYAIASALGSAAALAYVFDATTMAAPIPLGTAMPTTALVGSVALDRDGTRAVVGRPDGRADVFRRDAGGWSHEITLSVPLVSTMVAVAIDSAGTRIVVGADAQAIVFARTATGWDAGTPIATYPASVGAVAISGDGQHVLVSTPSTGGTIGTDGLVYYYTL